MPANKKPTVTYASASVTETWHPSLTELNAHGFFCMFQQEQCEGVTMGGGTSDYYILDLGLDSIRNAESIIKITPALAGRVIIVGAQPKDVAGVVFTTPQELVETVVKLHARLGKRSGS